MAPPDVEPVLLAPLAPVVTSPTMGVKISPTQAELRWGDGRTAEIGFRID